jgi:hypothetical protein
MLDELYRASCAEIEARYTASSNALGWRFLMCPRRNLSPDIRVAMITLNPGGATEPPDHPRESSEVGSAYLHETWPGHEPGSAPLQRQIQALFEQLNQEIGAAPDGRHLLEASLAGYFVPFRSRSWQTLEDKRQSIVFSRKLWTDIFQQIEPELVLCIDQRTTKEIRRILEARNHVRAEAHSLPTGWGQINAEVTRVGPTTLLRLPHLSRFRLFGRERSAEPLRNIVRAAARSLERKPTNRP